MTATNPTTRTYGGLQAAYDFFNDELFGGQLPPCLLTVQRKRGARGYFWSEIFEEVGSAARTDEIALNPQHFARGMEEVLSTLVHEQVHLWQAHFGNKQPRSGYHDRQWAAKMREVGLVPSDTGLLGGKETGQRMTHYIEEGGRFQVACRRFLAQHATTLYQDRQRDKAAAERKNASKTKYSCLACDVNAWAKPETLLVCGECGNALEAQV